MRSWFLSRYSQSPQTETTTAMAYIKSLLFLACVAAASAGLIAPLTLAGDDGSYWPGKYDLRELSPALGALPDGVAVRSVIPALAHPAIPAIAARAIPAIAHPAIPAIAARAIPGLALPAQYPYLI